MLSLSVQGERKWLLLPCHLKAQEAKHTSKVKLLSSVLQWNFRRILTLKEDSFSFPDCDTETRLKASTASSLPAVSPR